MTEQPNHEQRGLIRDAGGADKLASAADAAAFQDALLRLFAHRTAIYTMGDSSSVPKHVAADLLRSMCFVLGIDPDLPEIPQRLLGLDLDDEYRRRLDDIGRKVELTSNLWKCACASLPSISNIALEDTLVEIGNFPRVYDYRSLAHEIPVSIDYQLCHPVPEELAGVDWINEYLRRLIVENGFINRFETRACIAVLEASCPDYRGLLINLYEPVATNALGLAMIGKDPTGLHISAQDGAEVARMLSPLDESRRLVVLHDAAAQVCTRVGIDEEGAIRYLADVAPDLLPRIAVGLSHGDLSGVFVRTRRQ